MADVNRQTALHLRQQDAMAAELTQARQELQSLHETHDSVTQAREEEAAKVEEAEASLAQLRVRWGWS
jgi:chromosome segregation ATPase